MTKPKKMYVAYGSNMNRAQMSRRCPRAKQVGIVDIPGYKLAFMHHGVATILPDKDSSIQGLAWELTPLCELALDRYEGAPHFYSQQLITVRQDDINLEMMAYIMNPEYNKAHLPPDAYYECIEDAYIELGLDTAPLERALGEAALAEREQKLKRPPCKDIER